MRRWALVGISNTPEELIAMQKNKPERPDKPERQQSPKVKQVLELIEKLDTTAAEDQQFTMDVVRQLERLHYSVVVEMQNDADARYSQIVSWAAGLLMPIGSTARGCCWRTLICSDGTRSCRWRR
jgi:hypothetical protein